MPARPKSLEEIRSDVCDTTLVWITAIAIPMLSFSVSRVREIGWQPVIGLHMVLVVLLAVVTLFRRRIAYAARAFLLVTLMFLTACGGLLNFGSPAGLFYFCGASVMAAVLFGRPASFLTVILALLAMLAAYLGFRAGLLTRPDLNVVHSASSSWLANAGGVVITSLGPIIAASTFITQLSAERMRAEESSRAKSSFLATMSHELRTPMTAILGLSELISLESSEALPRERARRIHESGKLLLELVNDVLDFSKMEHHQVALERVHFSLPALFAEVEALFSPLAKKKDLAFALSLAAADRDVVMGDPTRLRQVLINLIGNAIKFTDEGFVRVEAALVEGEGDRQTLNVEVIDTGIGISPEQQEKLFQPFTQGDGTITRRFGGTGLGLAISRSVTNLMGGTLRVSSREGAGSTFSLSVPILAADGRAQDPVRGAARRAPSSSRSMRILVAEDNEALRYLTRSMLESRGHAVDVVSDGRQAIDALKDTPYDVVLMDVHMPVMDGVETVTRIRGADMSFSRVPIYAVTADVRPERLRILSQCGFTSVFPKPVDWNALFNAIENDSVRQAVTNERSGL